MIEQLVGVLEDKCRISRNDRVLIGVSGGIDSIALLDGMTASGYHVIVGHLDHGLRESSQEDAEFVRKVADERGTAFFTERVDARAFSSEMKMSLEEAARELRYTFLFKVAAENQCKAVAVGHTADDQAETILLHLLRGTGLNGLGGMDYGGLTQWHTEIELVRPLLDFSKETLSEYCIERELATLEDQTNQDVGFLRNRIRHEFLPALSEVNPQFSAGLGRLATIIRGDIQLLDQVTDVYWEEICRAASSDGVSFSREMFLSGLIGLQRRLMRKAVSILRPEMKDIGFEIIERAIWTSAQAPARRKIDLAQGMFLEVGQENIRLGLWATEDDLSQFPQLKVGQAIEMITSGEFELGEGWKIVLRKVDSPVLSEIRDNKDLFTTYLDLGEISPPILVRSRVEGDRIAPIGMEGREMKVSDLMINEGVPQPARGGWPIIEIGGAIAWIPGCRTAEKFKVKPGSTDVIMIRVIQIES